MKDSISVIIPTYNRAHCITRAIDSVLAQSMPPAEIIVVDDGSTDETGNLIKQKYPTITFIEQANQGVSHARNQGIAQASGNWIALLDSDDAWSHNKLAQQIDALKKTPQYLVCHTDEIWIRNGKRVNPMKKHQKSGGWIFEKCLNRCAISPSSVLIHKTVFKTVGAFDESLPACEDYDYWLRICAHYPVLFITEKLTIKYGGHEDQLSKHYSGMDRFRIYAIEKSLKSQQLSKENQQAALNTMLQKIKIYLNGAIKRNKTADINHYENLLKQWQTEYNN